MTQQGFLLVLFSSGLLSIGNFLLRIGINKVSNFGLGNLSELINTVLGLLSQPLFDLGFILYSLGTLVWFKVIASEPLNIAYPLLVSLTFIIVNLGGVIFFQDSLNFRQIIGLGVIIAGIVLLSGK